MEQGKKEKERSFHINPETYEIGSSNASSPHGILTIEKFKVKPFTVVQTMNEFESNKEEKISPYLILGHFGFAEGTSLETGEKVVDEVSGYRILNSGSTVHYEPKFSVGQPKPIIYKSLKEETEIAFKKHEETLKELAKH